MYENSSYSQAEKLTALPPLAMMMATGSALRYNLGGREVIAEEFPMAWPLSTLPRRSCNGEMPQELFAAKQRR